MENFLFDQQIKQITVSKSHSLTYLPHLTLSETIDLRSQCLSASVNSVPYPSNVSTPHFEPCHSFTCDDTDISQLQKADVC